MSASRSAIGFGIGGYLFALILGLPASAGNVVVPVEAGGPFNVPAKTLKESRFRATIRQQYDFSCGSAALSTLLTYHYNHPVTEQAVFEEMFRNGDPERIRRAGFSMLDIKRFLERRGFQANGFEAPLEKLERAKIPAIVLLNERGYNHFVVVKGIRNGRVLVGDPAGGTRVLTRKSFDAAWHNKILFVVTNRTELASFNGTSDWRAAPLAPLGDGVDRGGLTHLVLPKFGAGDF